MKRMAEAETKVNIGDGKNKKTYNKTLSEEQLQSLIGKQIGDTVNGDVLELAGYEFEITGGSDSTGHPMRKDVHGPTRKRILIANGVGMKKDDRKGTRKRKLLAGNTIHENTAQINLKVTKRGKDPIEAPPEESSENESQ